MIIQHNLLAGNAKRQSNTSGARRKKATEMRSKFGAYQNRLEHAYSVDQNTAENTQAAESRIRDTDMAKEMMEYAKSDILNNAAQAMIAQANRQPEGILKILS